MNELEIWKPVPGYEGLYEVSNLGNVKSLRRNRIMSPHHHDKAGGHLTVALTNWHRKDCLIHRLVWEAFNGPIPEGFEVNHIDENPKNNRLDNLNLLTHKENMNWGTVIERKSKWVIQLNKNDEILHFYPSAIQASRETGIRQGSISNVCVGRTKSAGGFLWKYAV